jgi:ketosteroid isomerase-like protein
MSEENVEAFRRGTDALERGTVDAALLDELIDPDVIFEPLRAPMSGTYRGHDGIRQFIADTAESFDVFRFDRADIRDLGDRVLAIGTLHIRARQGGVETDVPTAGIATYRDGRLIHWKDFGDRMKALEAAGLRE